MSQMVRSPLRSFLEEPLIRGPAQPQPEGDRASGYQVWLPLPCRWIWSLGMLRPQSPGQMCGQGRGVWPGLSTPLAASPAPGLDLPLRAHSPRHTVLGTQFVAHSCIQWLVFICTLTGDQTTTLVYGDKALTIEPPGQGIACLIVYTHQLPQISVSCVCCFLPTQASHISTKERSIGNSTTRYSRWSPDTPVPS